MEAGDWNPLEKSLLTYLAVDEGCWLGPHLKLLARTHDLGFLVAQQPHGVIVLTWKLGAPRERVPTEKVGRSIACSDPALKIMESHFCYILLVISKSQAHLDSMWRGHKRETGSVVAFGSLHLPQVLGGEWDGGVARRGVLCPAPPHHRSPYLPSEPRRILPSLTW